MKVYLVIEYWDNCEDYDDECYDTENICVAINEELAKREIQKRKEEILENFYTFKLIHKDVECTFEWDEDMNGITLKTSSQDGGVSGRSFGNDYYKWTIEEHDLIES